MTKERRLRKKGKKTRNETKKLNVTKHGSVPDKKIEKDIVKRTNSMQQKKKKKKKKKRNNTKNAVKTRRNWRLSIEREWKRGHKERE